ncbi:hypothetical protein COMNV_00905 [Commensalibacter sp. Nvir]|uniref:hypothetical protein n=1 Tax=Commensalibacter sp. Nvir TaxID=3069817 RepID=UPI002D240B32|nr:hypothetical protein COMNV_00905 [Commensalibacter sp. Nvir]
MIYVHKTLFYALSTLFISVFTAGWLSNFSSAQTQTPKPTPRPGMSEYQPADYSGTYSTNQYDSITRQKGPGLPGTTPSQSPARPYNGPSITIPGTNIKAYFNAPVTPPYNPSASYDTFAGQPGGNRSAILQQSVGGY